MSTITLLTAIIAKDEVKNTAKTNNVIYLLNELERTLTLCNIYH